MPVIRRAGVQDFSEISAIQASSPESAQWDISGYAGYDVWVAVVENRVAGFVAARSLGAGEYEVLNLAVAPEVRRIGIGRALVGELLHGPIRTVFLEVRESNVAARNLYKSLGFIEISSRPDYYHTPPETAIVMKFHSC